MIIGITGSFCAGKDTASDYLAKKGFIHYSLSDAIREEADKKQIKRTRENLQDLGNELRENYGNPVLANMALKIFENNKDYVVSSIRHSAEVDVLRKRPDFFLVHIYSPAKIRFRRMKERNREEDPKTFREFLELEKKESQTKGPGQQLKKCQEMAKITVIHDKEFKELYDKLNRMVYDLRLKLYKK